MRVMSEGKVVGEEVEGVQWGWWFGDRDSNPDKQIQSLRSCR